MAVRNPETIVATIGDKVVRYGETAQGGGYIFKDNQWAIPERAPSSVWTTVKDVLKSGLDIWKTTQEIKTIRKKQSIERTPTIIPNQPMTSPFIISIPEKPIEQKQPQGSIFDKPLTIIREIPQAISTIAQAPELVKRGERISQAASMTGWVIFGGLVFLGLVLLTRRR